MDAGQITQGLRADSFQQNANGNGISAAQMTGNGFSFADIISIILANGQEMQNVENVQELSNVQIMGNLTNNEFTDNLFDAKNLLGFNGLQGFQDLLNVINTKDIEASIDEFDSKNLFDLLSSLELQNPLDQKKIIAEISNLFEIKNNDWNIKSDDSFDLENVSDSNNFSNEFNESDLKAEADRIDSKYENTLNIPNTPNVSKNHAINDHMWVDNIEVNETEIKHKDVLNIQNIISSNVNPENSDLKINYETIDNSETEDDYLVSENVNSSDKFDVKNIDKPEDLIDNFTDNFKDVPDSISTSQLYNVSNKQEIHSAKNISEQQNDIKIKGTSNRKFKTFKSQNSVEKIDKIQNISNMQNIPDIQTTQDIQNVQNAKDAVYGAYNVMNLRDIHVVSDILGFGKEEKSSIQKNINFQNVNSENPISQKLIEIFNAASPEILKAFQNEQIDKNVNNGSKFVMDLISELSNEKNKSDIFDFSESVVKVDPLQLAGLLDFISTGTTIPQANDISDSQLFKNIDKTEVVANSSGKLVFDPEEMIRTGEMEIVSYVPAEKKLEDADLNQDKNPIDNSEKTIDFARTMKSVKENVKPVSVDETEKTDDAVAMTVEDMNNSAEKIDISFDRAYAELEMNKAKYGSADKQLFKGITENLKKGRSEFTVKLRPEGLGEILVKLVSNEVGKTILSMVASSEKTAQLLNRDLASLQSSLNQHNVEIENNSVKTVETVMAAQSSFDQYDERRQDEANQQNQFRKLRSKLGNISVGNVSFENESEPVNNVNIDSALNITI